MNERLKQLSENDEINYVLNPNMNQESSFKKNDFQIIMTENIPLCNNCYFEMKNGEYICSNCKINICDFHLKIHLEKYSNHKIIQLKLTNN